MTQLSPHFTLNEMTVSETAARMGINNRPPSGALQSLILTCNMMESVRELLGHPIYVTSGYRCLQLNRLIGSKDNSQHVIGEAVDFVCRKYGSVPDVVNAIDRSDLPFDQLIREFANSSGGGWVHISWSHDPARPNRRQVLSIG